MERLLFVIGRSRQPYTPDSQKKRRAPFRYPLSLAFLLAKASLPPPVSALSGVQEEDHDTSEDDELPFH